MRARAMHSPTTTFPSLSWLVDRSRRNARRVAVWLVRLAVYCADRYSATVQYEELSKLTHADLERRGIARGDLHRHIADSLAKRPRL